MEKKPQFKNLRPDRQWWPARPAGRWIKARLDRSVNFSTDTQTLSQCGNAPTAAGAVNMIRAGTDIWSWIAAENIVLMASSDAASSSIALASVVLIAKAVSRSGSVATTAATVPSAVSDMCHVTSA